MPLHGVGTSSAFAASVRRIAAGKLAGPPLLPLDGTLTDPVPTPPTFGDRAPAGTKVEFSLLRRLTLVGMPSGENVSLAFAAKVDD